MKYLFILAAYLFGSIPTGYLLVRWTGRKDVRDFGSHSTGATNVLRVGGWKSALPVAVFDILKGFLPVFLALRLFDEPRLAAVCGFAAVVGHCYPFAIGFRGGKGVATALGAFLAIAWLPCLACLGLFLVVVDEGGVVLGHGRMGQVGVPVLVVALDQPPARRVVARHGEEQGFDHRRAELAKGGYRDV